MHGSHRVMHGALSRNIEHSAAGNPSTALCILAAYVVDAASAGWRRRFFCHSAFSRRKKRGLQGTRLLYAQLTLCISGVEVIAGWLGLTVG